MTITTLRPTGAETKRGQITYSSGTTIVPLVDDVPYNDASYVSCANGSQWPETAFWLNLPDNSPVLAANQRIKQVRVGVRVSLSATDGGRSACIGVDTRDDRDGTGTGNEKICTASTTFTGKVGVWRTKPTSPSLSELNQEDLNHYQIYCNFYHTGGTVKSNLRVSELYLDVDVRTLGTLTGVTVAGESSSARPTVSWTFTPNADNDIQKWYRVKIFSSTQYGAPGFKAATSQAFWDSGILSGNADSLVVGTELTPAVTFKAYVNSAQDFNGQQWWVGYTVSNTFTMPPATIPVPTLTVVPDVTVPRLRNKITVRANFNMLSAQDASFDDSTLGVGSWLPLETCTLARGTGQTAYGVGSMIMTATGVNGMAAITVTGTGGIPVRGSQQYTFMAEFRTVITARSVRVGVRWYDYTGTIIGAEVAGSVVVDSATGWVQSTLTANAPTNAGYAAVVVRVLTTTSVNEQHYVDKVGMITGPLP